MTVQSTLRKAGPFAGNGAATQFPFAFKVFSAGDVAVVRTTDLEVETVLTLDSDYSVALNPDQDAAPGGTVVYPALPGAARLATGLRLTITGAMAAEQLTDITNAGRFNPDVFERALDKSVILAQQLAEGLSRTVQVPVSSSTSPAELVGNLLQIGASAAASASSAATSAAKASTNGATAGASAGATAGASAGATAGTAAGTTAGYAAGAAAGATAGATAGASAGTSAATAAATSAGNTAGAAAGATAGGTAGASAGTAAATSQVNAFKSNMADMSGTAGFGSFLMGFRTSPYGVSVGRTVQDKLDDFVNARDFGLKTTNTGAQNVTALQNAINYSTAVGGCTVHIPRGTYYFNASINLTSAHNLRLVGDGTEATILCITHPTLDFFTATGSLLYTAFEHFTLSSSVTRTAGAMFKPGFWRRGYMHRVKISEHFDGINLPGYEQSTLSEVFIVKPSGAGVALICGVPSTVNVGANLNVLNCFMRGNDELTNNTPIGLIAVVVYDVEALFFMNSDMANFRDRIMVVNPQTRAANCYFLQSYFDGTLLSDNVLMTGGGIKQQFQFTGCWFNGAGQFGAGAANAYGINCIGSGEYFDINFSGCRWLSHSSTQFVTTSPFMDFTFAGCVFTNPGLRSDAAQRSSVLLSPSQQAVKWPVFSGCKFQGTPVGSYNIVLNNAAAGGGVLVNGCNFDRGIIKPPATYLGNVSGCFDPANVNPGVAAASTIVVSACTGYCIVTGSAAPIVNIAPTFAGHQLTLRPVAASTFVKDGAGGNLRLSGNFVGSGTNTLTLVCEANGDWREVARATN